MEKTNAMGLELPTLDEPISLSQMNENFDKIDVFCAPQKAELLEMISFNASTSFGKLDWQWETYSQWVVKIDIEEGYSCTISTTSATVVSTKTGGKAAGILNRACSNTSYNCIYSYTGNSFYDINTVSASNSTGQNAVFRLYGIRGFDI